MSNNILNNESMGCTWLPYIGHLTLLFFLSPIIPIVSLNYTGLSVKKKDNSEG